MKYIIGLLFSALMFAQTPATTSTTSTVPATPPTAVATTTNGIFQPAYFVGAGITYDYYGKTGFAANTDIGIRIGSTNIYSYTTLELATTTSTLRTGAAYLFYQTGNWSLLALGDAGLATSTSSLALGSFSGGGLMLYDVGNKVTKGSSHFYIGVGGRFIQTASLGSQPVFVLTFGKGL